MTVYNPYRVFRLATQPIIAAGNDQATSPELSANCLNAVSGADGTKGVILPSNPKGKTCLVQNAAGSALKVYPSPGAAINGGSGDAAVEMAANTMGIFVGGVDLAWSAMFTPEPA